MKSEPDSEPLNASTAMRYSGIVARMSFGPDRCETQFAVKELDKDVSNATQVSWTRMKRLSRYPMGAPRAVLHFCYQKRSKALFTWTDSDFAGCEVQDIDFGRSNPAWHSLA